MLKAWFKAWWQQHVDSTTVTRAKSPAEREAAIARYKESSTAFIALSEQQGATGGLRSKRVNLSHR